MKPATSLTLSPSHPAQTGGKIDSVIVYNRETGEITIRKINDTKKNPFTVNLTVRQGKDGSYSITMGLWSRFLNAIGRLLKRSDDVQDGTYNLDDPSLPTELSDWYDDAAKQHPATVGGWKEERKKNDEVVQE